MPQQQSIEMSKWNKKNKELTTEFLQNEEQRKQMVIEAARRRREKEEKLKEQEERERREQEQALNKHKQEKKDAYVKYLRSNDNIHDKYENLKRIKKETTAEIKSNAKWKKKNNDTDSNATPTPNNNLEALDLEVKLDSQVIGKTNESGKKASGSAVRERKQLEQQFQRQWNTQHNSQDLLSSKLLDSLDLDIDTINRQIEIQQHIRKDKDPKKEEVKQLRELIGYESTVFTPNQQPPPKKIVPEKTRNQPVKPEINEVEAFNELKRKKEAKILNWAIEEEQQAEDLFSNCSTNKKKQPKALKQLNQQLKSKQTKQNIAKNKPKLPVIAQEATTQPQPQANVKTEIIPVQPSISTPQPISSIQSTKPKVNSNIASRSNERASSKQKRGYKKGISQTQTRFDKGETRKQASLQKKSQSKTPVTDKIKQTKQAKTASGFTSQKNIIRMRTTSRQKALDVSKQKRDKTDKLKVVEVAPRKIGGVLPPLPNPKYDSNSIATQDVQIDVESFIKQDLINLNEQQYKIQEELRQLHKNHKNDIKEVYSKYEIKADYKHSNEISGEQVSRPNKYLQNQYDIEQSIQNLDNLLIRREIYSREQQKIIKEATEEDSLSYINPFSNSEDLCNQVLKLAKNVSRFEKPPAQINTGGYAFAKKNKKNQSVQKNQEKQSISKGNYADQGLCESQQVSQMADRPLGQPPSILYSEPKTNEKIHVNARLLKNLLMDDD